MITKNDWDQALESWVAAERERLGGPPAPKEVAAFLRGELPHGEAARVRALLVYDPELTSLLDKPAAAPRPVLRRLMPLAAGLVIAVLGALQIQSRIEIARLARERSEPYIHQTRHELRALQFRGGGAAPPVFELPAGEERYLIVPILSDAAHDPRYRIEIKDLSEAGAKTVWSADRVQPVEGAFAVSVPRDFLLAGPYQLDVYGVDDEGAHLRDRYRLRVTARR